jgi:hypothetical protein
VVKGTRLTLGGENCLVGEVHETVARRVPHSMKSGPPIINRDQLSDYTQP